MRKQRRLLSTVRTETYSNAPRRGHPDVNNIVTVQAATVAVENVNATHPRRQAAEFCNRQEFLCSLDQSERTLSHDLPSDRAAQRSQPPARARLCASVLD